MAGEFRKIFANIVEELYAKSEECSVDTTLDVRLSMISLIRSDKESSVIKLMGDEKLSEEELTLLIEGEKNLVDIMNKVLTAHSEENTD